MNTIPSWPLKPQTKNWTWCGMVELPGQPRQVGESWTRSTRAQERCCGMWALCSARWNKKLDLMFPQLQLQTEELPKVHLYSLGGQSVSTWGRNAFPVLPAVLMGFFHRGLPLLLNLPQLPPTYCCMERETTWIKIILQSNLKRKSRTLSLMQKSTTRDHHRRETVTQALEQACSKWPAIPW